MAPRVLVSDKLSPTAVEIFKESRRSTSIFNLMSARTRTELLEIIRQL